jgi:putative hydrolase of the HAD superfamily
MQWRGVVFDLDDTLFFEEQFVRSGFRYVAEMLSSRVGVCSSRIFASLWCLYEQGVRGDTFDRLVRSDPELAQRVQVHEIVAAYRRHTPRITLLPGLSDLLDRLCSQGCRLGILTDGPAESQEAKIASLELDAWFYPLVVTDFWSRKFWKPHPRGYQQIQQIWGYQPHDLMYVGDNPEKDFITPRRLGWQTTRLRIEGQLRCRQEAPSPEQAADHEVYSINELDQFLNSC